MNDANGAASASAAGSMSAAAPLVLTAGESAGIGPDLCVALAQSPPDVPLVVVACPQMLAQRAAMLGQPLRILPWDGGPAAPLSGALHLLAAPQAQAAVAGRPDVRNVAGLLDGLQQALDGCLAGRFRALVTGPVHKAIINDAGIAFCGHTEWLAQRTGGAALMMLAADGLRVALATTHLPLAAVPDAIRRADIGAMLDLLHRELQGRFAIAAPRLAVAGLNPHAGEGGHLGDEDDRHLAPAVAAARTRGLDAHGPLAADSLFAADRRADFDAVLAMYHDQGLAPLKALAGRRAVNITLGLPIVRTSVDHGTALALAGGGTADPASLRAAIQMAARLSAA